MKRLAICGFVVLMSFIGLSAFADCYSNPWLPGSSTTIVSCGSVGIGASPTQALTVAGNINKSGSWILAGDVNWSGSLELHTGSWNGSSNSNYGTLAAGKGYFYEGLQSGGATGSEAGPGQLYASGNVGFGAAPATAARLQVSDTTRLASRVLLSGQEYWSATAPDAGGLAMLLGVNRTGNRQLWIADSSAVGSVSGTNKAVRMLVGSGVTAAPVVDAVGLDGSDAALTVGNTGGVSLSPSGGRVGIGMTAASAAYTLDVAGTIHGTNVIATYQDVAEWVPAAEEMAPGTVVVVQSGSLNTVSLSRRAYDTSVAGVVSAQPGVILGVAAPSKALVATTGRVKVRVDASHGRIDAGDLLVTSDRPGVAMRSEPIDLGGAKLHRPGTLIGKALEPLAGGEGEILVLLSLQ